MFRNNHRWNVKVSGKSDVLDEYESSIIKRNSYGWTVPSYMSGMHAVLKIYINPNSIREA
jgi:hypothetical protein